MLFYEWMTTCPKCKIWMRDLIKLHFLGGAHSNPLPIYFSPIDPVLRGNFRDAGPLPVAVLSSHDPRYVQSVPVIHSRGSAVAIGKVVYHPNELFEVGSFTVRTVMKRLGEERFPPVVSSLNERYGAEVLNTLRRLMAR